MPFQFVSTGHSDVRWVKKKHFLFFCPCLPSFRLLAAVAFFYEFVGVCWIHRLSAERACYVTSWKTVPCGFFYSILDPHFNAVFAKMMSTCCQLHLMIIHFLQLLERYQTDWTNFLLLFFLLLRLATNWPLVIFGSQLILLSCHIEIAYISCMGGQLLRVEYTHVNIIVVRSFEQLAIL